jgi:hypothetical protein
MNLTFDQKIALARSSTATAEQLTKLANDKNSYVRRGVAEHPNCPISILEKLANDEDWQVLYYVARHPNCPQYLKDYLKIKSFIRRSKIQF